MDGLTRQYYVEFYTREGVLMSFHLNDKAKAAHLIAYMPIGTPFYIGNAIDLPASAVDEIVSIEHNLGEDS